MANLTGQSNLKKNTQHHGAYDPLTGTTTTSLGGLSVTGSPGAAGATNFDFNVGDQNLFSSTQGMNAKTAADSGNPYAGANAGAPPLTQAGIPPAGGQTTNTGNGIDWNSLRRFFGSNAGANPNQFASLNQGQDPYGGQTPNWDLSQLPGVPQNVVDQIYGNFSQLAPALGAGPQNYFNPNELNQFQQQALELLGRQDQQAMAGAASANAARGVTGPSLDALIGNQLDAQRRGVAAGTKLDATRMGAELGNQKYGLQSQAAGMLGQLGQNAATLQEDEWSRLLQGLNDKLNIREQGSETRQTDRQQHLEQLDQKITDYLHSRGLNEQQSGFTMARDVLQTLLSMGADPALFALKGDEQEELEQMQNIFSGWFDSLFGFGTGGTTTSTTPGTGVGAGTGVTGGTGTGGPPNLSVPQRTPYDEMFDRAGRDISDFKHVYHAEGLGGLTTSTGGHDLKAGFDSLATGNVPGKWTVSNWSALNQVLNNDHVTKELWKEYRRRWKEQTGSDRNPPVEPLLRWLEDTGRADFGGYKDSTGDLGMKSWRNILRDSDLA